MIVFHGSYMTVDRPMVEQGRQRVDFGRGFYLTGLREQAATWAVAVSRRHRGGAPVLNVFDLDLDRALALAGSRQRRFAESGVITADQALGLLAHKRVNHQIAILSQRIVDGCLRYLGSEEVRYA